MGKSKKLRGFRAQCALSDLHSPSAENFKNILIHPSKIHTADLEKLLAKVGRSRYENGKWFSGSICHQCVHIFVSDMAMPASVTPSKETRSTPLSENNQDFMDTQSIDESLFPFLPVQTSDANVDTEPVLVLRMSYLRNDIKALPADTRAHLAYELAAAERENIRSDTAIVSHVDRRNLDQLSTLCGTRYLNSRNLVLVHFLLGLYHVSESAHKPHIQNKTLALPDQPLALYRLCKATEICMGLTRPTSILPYHVRELLLMYSLTRSRQALTIIASTAPHGSYQTVKSFLDELAQSAPAIIDSGDILGAFDNNQVVQRRWNISVDCKAMCSITTTVMFMEIEPQGDLQFREDLKPTHWMWEALDPEMIEYLRRGYRNPEHQQTRFWKHLYPWLLKILQEVADEQKLVDGGCCDEVDRKIEQDKYKQCPKCLNAGVPRNAKICPTCKEKVPNLTKTQDQIGGKSNSKSAKPGEVEVTVDFTSDGKCNLKFNKTTHVQTEYDHLQHRHPEKPPKVTVGQPIFVNPCSYSAVAEVFRQVGKQAGIKRYGGRREWMPMVCDGLPFVMGYQLIERTFICLTLNCGVSVEGLDGRLEHSKTHGGTCDYEQEFDWILLQPGPGHVEMNMLKAFVKFTWPVFWEGLVEVFNFKSELAKRVAHNVSDHHKGWTLARIARESLAKEMVLPYVRQQLQKQQELTVAGFLQYAMSTDRSPNYVMMSDLTFVLLDAIFCYRCGIRTANIDLMEAGKAFFSRLWSARSHPMYRQLSAYDSIMNACMPPCVKEFMKKTKSINVSGVPGTGEGADFKLEAVNKNVQKWLTCRPKEKDWNASCANYPKLSSLHDTALTAINLKDPKQRAAKPSTNISKQVLAFRSAVRQKDFLVDKDKNGKTPPLMSYHGVPLDPDMVKCATTAGEKEVKFLNAFLDHKIDQGFLKRGSISFKEDPVFVTVEEKNKYNDISSKTISVCKDLIQSKIAEIKDDEMRKYYGDTFKSNVLHKKGGKAAKKEYLLFHDKLLEYENSVSDDQDDTLYSDSEDDE